MLPVFLLFSGSLYGQCPDPDALMLSVTDIDVLCNGESTGSINLTVSGGETPYTFDWNNGASDVEDPTGLGANTYTVTVTDDDGCEATISTVISEPTELTLSTSLVQNVQCNGESNGSATATPSGGTSPYTYLWESSETTATAAALNAGTQDVTVTDANGCTVTGAQLIQQPSQLTASATGETLSNQGDMDGNVDLTVADGTSPYTYIWSNNATTQDLSGLGSGLYSVTVTDANGCTAFASTSIIDGAPVCAISNVVATPSCTSTCPQYDLVVSFNIVNQTVGNTYFIFVDNTPYGPYQYTANSSQSQTITSSNFVGDGTAGIVVAIGNLVINEIFYDTPIVGDTDEYFEIFNTSPVAIDLNGYSVSDEVSHSFSSGASIPGDGFIVMVRNDNAVTLPNGISEFNYSSNLSDNGTLVLNGPSSSNVTLDEVNYADRCPWPQENLCGGSGDPDGGGPTIELTNPDLDNDNGSNWVTSAANSGSPGAVNSAFTGNYCGGSTTFTEPVCSASTPSISITGSVSCEGGSDGELTATSGSAISYEWSSGQTSSIAAGLSAGNYTVTATDASGCTATASATLADGDPVQIIGLENDPYCQDNESFTIVGLPLGGSFSATQIACNGIVTNNQNNPGIAVFTPSACSMASGQNTITVTYNTGTGCTLDSVVTVNAPTVTLASTLTTFDPGDSNGYDLTDAANITITDFGQTITNGVFSGDGVANNIFFPNLSTPPTATITYSFLGDGCAGEATLTFNIQEESAISGLNIQYCSNDPVETISNTQSSGNCSGGTIIDISSNTLGGSLTFNGNNYQFDPTMAPVGAHNVTALYQILNPVPTICSQDATIQVLSAPIPTLTFSPDTTSFCPDTELINLIGESPSGGSFTLNGNALSSSVIENAQLLPGQTSTVVYTVTENGCTETITSDFTVFPTPDIPSFTSTLGDICQGDPTVILTADPQGSSFSFSGEGVSQVANDWIFNPSGLTGTIEVTYVYLDDNGCQGTVSGNFDVTESLPIGFNNLATEFCLNGGTDQIGVVNTNTQSAIPVIDGSFEITAQATPGIAIAGVIDGTGNFDPSMLSASGFYNISFSYPNPGSICSSSITQLIEVKDPPSFANSNLSTTYCDNGSDVTLTSTSGTAVFEGMAITNNLFSPSSLQAGNYTVTMTDNGCSITTSITVEAEPTVMIDSPEDNGEGFCADSPAMVLGSSLAGGVFTINNNVVSTLDPALYADPSGDIDVVVEYTVTSGVCTVNSTRTYTVHPLPTGLDIENLATAYCADEDDVMLDGSLDNLTESWSYVNVGGGTPINSDVFQPSQLSPGTYTVTYTVVDGNMCSSFTTQNTTINALPEPTLTDVAPQYCVDNDPITLTGNPSPSDGMSGTYSIFADDGMGNLTPSPGVDIDMFNPASAGVGNFQLIYIFTDNNSCTDTATTPVEILPLPVVSISPGDTEVCDKTDPFVLTGLPSTGGTGVFLASVGVETDINGTQFNPTAASVGVHPVTYQFTDTNSCTNEAIINVTVNALPVVDITGLNNENQDDIVDFCIDPDSVDVFSIFPTTGGTGSLTLTLEGEAPVMTAPLFTPSVVGSHLMTYTFTEDVNQCTNLDTVNITVNPLPDGVTIVGLESDFCTEVDQVILLGFPNTGGNGNFFMDPVGGDRIGPINGFDTSDPLFPVGDYDVLYEFTDLNSCVNTATQQITIHPSPIASFIKYGFCEDFEIAFVNQSFYDPPAPGEELSQFNWIVPNLPGGQSEIASLTVNNPLPGNDYELTFTVASQFGCQDDTTFVFDVGTAPRVDFRAPVVGLGDVTRFEVFDPLEFTGTFPPYVPCGSPEYPFYSYGLDTDPNSAFELVTQYTYQFGEDPAMDPQPACIPFYWHTYDAVGRYDASAGVNTSGFCNTDTTKPVIVVPREIPTAENPYSEDFESGDGNWIPLARDFNQNSIWTHTGTESLSSIQETVFDIAGNNVWFTRTDNGTYAIDEDSWVYGPCFDLTNLQRPMIKLDIWNETQEGFDGVVMEYSTDGFNWIPFGQVGEGRNWYDDIIIGQPGDQEIAPIGWTGIYSKTSARYKLDGFRNETNFCIRIAFGSDGNNPAATNLSGFAFDNIWVGERTRNVLFEHFTNIQTHDTGNDITNGPGPYDQEVYDRLLNFDYDNAYYNPYDVVLAQYHIEFPSPDEIHALNTADPSARTLFYGISDPGRAKLNGSNFDGVDGLSVSNQFTQFDLDTAMLKDPLFEIEISSFNVSSGNVSVSTVIRALEDIPFENNDVFISVLENNVNATGGTLQNVVRKLLPNASGTPFEQSWSVGQTATVNEQWAFSGSEVQNQNELNVIVFIQNRQTKEVYQAVAQTANIITDVEPVEPESLLSSKVYPVPVSGMLSVEFNTSINEDLNWILFDAAGRQISEGIFGSGDRNFQIGMDNIPEGYYTLKIGDDYDKTTYHKIIVIH